jgi:hypothetical protein
MSDPSIVPTAEEAAGEYIVEVREKIVHFLTVYPKISPSMLQAAIGPNVRPAIWHPILDDLVIRGIVDKTQVHAQLPSGRATVHTIISLVNTAQ